MSIARGLLPGESARGLPAVGVAAAAPTADHRCAMASSEHKQIAALEAHIAGLRSRVTKLEALQRELIKRFLVVEAALQSPNAQPGDAAKEVKE